MRIHLLEAVNSKKQLPNGVIIAYSVPQEPAVNGVDQHRIFKYLRINNNYLFSKWAKKNAGQSEDSVENNLISYIASNELTAIGLEEDVEYEKSLGFQAAINSFCKSFLKLCSDPRIVMVGAFAASVTFLSFISPRVIVENSINNVITSSVSRGG